MVQLLISECFYYRGIVELVTSAALSRRWCGFESRYPCNTYGPVVEWFTMPPCHGVWCGFESRQARID